MLVQIQACPWTTVLFPVLSDPSIREKRVVYDPRENLF